MRNLHDQIEAHYLGLEALGVDQITYSTIVVPMLMEKISEGVRFNMIRSTEKKQINWGLDDLLVALGRQLEIHENHVSVFKSGGSQEKGTRPKRGDDTATTASSLFVDGGKDGQCKCVYCLKEHAPEDCSNVTDTTVRKSILIKYARCCVCLNSIHRAFECRNKVPCKIC